MDPNFHDNKGRFKKGNKGGPGNPQLQNLAKYKRALGRAVKAKDIRDILIQLIGKAKNGDVMAAKVILDRCLGKVPQAIEFKGENALQSVQITFAKLEEDEKKEKPSE